MSVLSSHILLEKRLWLDAIKVPHTIPTIPSLLCFIPFPALLHHCASKWSPSWFWLFYWTFRLALTVEHNLCTFNQGQISGARLDALINNRFSCLRELLQRDYWNMKIILGETIRLNIPKNAYYLSLKPIILHFTEHVLVNGMCSTD